jgi:hypothetical protein
MLVLLVRFAAAPLANACLSVSRCLETLIVTNFADHRRATTSAKAKLELTDHHLAKRSPFVRV